MKKYAIILAAGKGTRMKSLREDLSKVSFPILGRPLVKYVLEALKPLGLDKIVTVVGFGGQTSEGIVKADSEVVWQKEQKGTGHAVAQAAPVLEDQEGETIICCGDTPLLTTKTLAAMFSSHETNHNALTIMTAQMSNPQGYGRIVKEKGRVMKIVEQKDCTPEQAEITEVNAGVYIFDNKELFKDLKRLTPNNAAGEYYLTDVIGMFVNDGLKVSSFTVADNSETLGINDRYQLSIAAKILQQRINKAFLLSGVSIDDPDTTYIGPDVKIGQDTVIRAGTYLMGNTTIGLENVIGPNCYIENCEIGDYNEIIYSHLTDTKVGNKTTLGPYMRARKNAVLKDGAHVGNFMELKNVEFGVGSKAAHLSYLGDATIGDGVNIGCGTIIANYDGVNKFHTEIGNNVFVGSGSTLISPVHLGDDAFVAAGSTLNKDVPAHAMAIARARQENKAGYSDVLHEKALAKKAAKK
jgi:bifunctional UDP-N-acetylglucosamine pyrophosphorylase / glucosamine-1-phosphate N-acetyltransferase